MPVTIEALIDRQLRHWEHERRRSLGGTHADVPIASEPVLTISRQHGSRGAEVAALVAERLGYTLLHRNVIDRLVESTGHTRRLLESLDEHTRSRITMWVESMLAGRFVDEHDYAVGLLKTIRSIASLGGVVVVGRGANFIVGPEHGMHVRIVGPREERVRQLVARKHLTEAAAAREVDTVDQERRAFIRRLFGRSVDDPLAYDLVLNEGGFSVESLTSLITTAAAVKFERLRRRSPVHAG